MRVAWCPAHRGVMRISFFDPPQPHFRSPCPRCQGVLTEQPFIKGQSSNRVAEGTGFPGEQEEVVSLAPRRVCECCCVAHLTHGNTLCGWCIDCPTEYCDVPVKFKRVMATWDKE